jgi:hypothetical protein
MNVRTTRSEATPATTQAPARMPMRRRSRLSAADRFWMILGSVAGLILAPAAGIALLPDSDGAAQGRASSPPEPDSRGTGADSLRAATESSAASSAPTSLAAQAADLGQETQQTPDPMAFSMIAVPGVLSGRVLSGGGGSPGTQRSTSDSAATLDPTLVAPPARVPGLQPALPVLPFDPVATLPVNWPRLSEVTRLGSDGDTWGIAAAFLIVSRAQDHMLQTSDGVLHMLINRGIDRGLTLISSHDGGKTWIVTDADGFGISNQAATSDIRLLDGQDAMIVTYVDDTGRVVFAIYGYDPFTGQWTRLQSSIVDADPASFNMVQATVAMTDSGTILLAYTEETPGGLRVVLQQSLDGGRTWSETVLVQPDIAAGTARTIAAGDHEGIIYSNADAVYWLTWDDTGNWSLEVIDAAGSIGRFASHFSTVTIDDDVVVANVGTDLALRILLFDGDTGTWSDPIMPLGADIDVSSAQISVSNDTGYIYVTFDDASKPGRLIVIESRDGGETWQLEAILQTPPVLVAPPTRFEAPEHFDGDLVIAQQILDPRNTNANGLFYHSVDVDGAGQPIPPDVLLAYSDGFLF